MKKITVSDVTLRTIAKEDLALNFRERLAIAEKLDSAKLDAIELPVLTGSKENEVIYRTIASSIKNATVKIPVGSSEESLNAAVECVKGAHSVCLQVVMPVSTVQMEYFYHLKAPLMLAKITELVSLASKTGYEVEFVANDAFRAEDGFVIECAKAAYNAGAKTITVCDDAGEAFPEDYAKIVSELKCACDVKVCVQPSNDMSMAAACAVQAIRSGADGVKTSVVGSYLAISVISAVMQAKKYELGVDCDVDATNVKTLSAAINDIAEVEESAVQEKVGGHISTNAQMKDVVAAVKQLGYDLSDSDLGKVYEEFKKLAAKKETIDNKELEAVVASTAMQVPSTYHLVNYVVNSSNVIQATANVTLEKDGEKFTGVSTGDGPIDAAFHAIEQIIGHHYELDDFQVHAVTKGRGAVGSSIIRLRADGKLYPGNGVSTDIIGACIRAYVNALNKIVYEEK